MVMEVLVPTPAIRNLIREDKIHQIYSAMQTGTGQTGMQTFNQGLANAYFAKAHHPGYGAVAFVEPGRIAGHDQPRSGHVRSRVARPPAGKTPVGAQALSFDEFEGLGEVRSSKKAFDR